MSVKVLHKVDLIEGVVDILVAGEQVLKMENGWEVTSIEFWQVVETREVDELTISVKKVTSYL